MLNAPCKGCAERTLSCHSECKRYLEYHEDRIRYAEYRAQKNEKWNPVKDKRAYYKHRPNNGW